MICKVRHKEGKTPLDRYTRVYPLSNVLSEKVFNCEHVLTKPSDTDLRCSAGIHKIMSTFATICYGMISDCHDSYCASSCQNLRIYGQMYRRFINVLKNCAQCHLRSIFKVARSRSARSNKGFRYTLSDPVLLMNAGGEGVPSIKRRLAENMFTS